MYEKYEALAAITDALAAVSRLSRSREASLARTKLEEAYDWTSRSGPSLIEWNQVGNVATTELPLGSMRIEVVGPDRASCSVRIIDSTPIDLVVIKPPDRELLSEATDVLAGIYWSRQRALDVRPGIVEIYKPLTSG